MTIHLSDFVDASSLNSLLEGIQDATGTVAWAVDVDGEWKVGECGSSGGPRAEVGIEVLGIRVGAIWVEAELVPSCYRRLAAYLGKQGELVREARQAKEAGGCCKGALQDCEKKLHAVINGSPIAQFVIDKEHKILHWNQSLEQISGIKSEEVIGTTRHWSAFYDKERPCIADLLVDGKESEGALWYPGVMRRSFNVTDAYEASANVNLPRRGRRVLLFTAALIKDSNGEVIGSIETVQDMTDRKVAESSLGQARNFLDKIINSVADPIFVKDRGRRWVLLNDAYCGFVGRTREELIGRSEFDVYPTEEAEAFRRHDDSVFSGGRETTTEERLTDARGQTHQIVTKRASYVNEDGETFIVGVIRDVTEMKAVQSALVEERKLFVAGPTVVFRWKNAAGWPVEYVSPNVEQQLGYLPEELLSGKVSYSSLLHPDDLTRVGSEVAAFTTPGTSYFEQEYRIRRKDGTYFWVFDFTSILRDEQGNVLHYYGYLVDITKRKRTEDLEQQLLQSRKMESVGLLAGGIAHDFNNILTPILGYTELISVRLRSETAVHAELREIRKAAIRAKELTQQLLAFSRKQVIERRVIDLGAAIHNAECMLRRTIRENVRIELSVERESSFVLADPGQIEQVVINLSINAQDAMVQGGVLRIAVHNVQISPENEVLGIGSGDYVVLDVQDTGAGMNAETLDHIFEPFYTTKVLGKGTGLGLSTAYGIVKQHEGHIRVRSEVGQGTSFRIYLPRVANGVERGEDSKPLEALAGGNETILVVEDNETVRVLATQMLEHLGYRVLESSSVERGEELIATHPGEIALLLTDVIMPSMNGKELYERARKRRAELKVLYMSGYAGSIVGEHGVEGEGMRFLPKPFELQSLARKVRMVLDAEVESASCHL